MDQLRKLLKSLSLRQRFTLAVAALAVIAGLVTFVHWNNERGFKPLYSSLSAEDAGAIVAKLKESGVDYRLHDSDSTILVPTSKVAELRLQMATAGIPKSGRIGYELFDKTNLGATDFTEQVNYHRAIEGELERSVMAMSEVTEARVHITFPKESVFTEEQKPAKASVMVKLKTGAKLSEQNASAIAQLVSSAVEGLGPEGISVMDMHGNLLIRPRKPGDGTGPSDEVLQYKHKLENETEAKINAVLDPLLGSEKYRASVDIDCDLTSGEQSEETFDPSHSVLTSSQRSEEGSTARGSTGVPGTQSNLPRPTFRPPTAGANGLARRTESMNYETSRTVRRIRMPQGIVHRMSVSVLVDQNVRWEMVGKGKQAHPQKFIDVPAPERMKTIQAVIAAAVGVNTTRGDQLSVETLPFAATLTAEPPASMVPGSGTTAKPANKFSPVMLGSIGGGALLVLVLGFFFLKSRKKKKAQLELQKQLAAAQAAKAIASQSHDGSKEHSDSAPTLDDLAEALKLPAGGNTKTEILTRQVNEQAHKDPAALAHIVRTWLNEPAEG